MAKQLRNPGKLEFTAIIHEAGGGGAYVEFPFDTKEVFGISGRIPVVVHIDGEHYRGSMVRMETTCHLVPVVKAIRENINKGDGDSVFVTVELDDQPRVIEPPEDLQDAFEDDKAAWKAFKKLAYTHQREYVKWIEEAKRSETRIRRIKETIRKLTENAL
jgi:hypothetical protein